MSERLIQFRKNMGEKVGKFLKEFLELPPSYEEAVANFQHGQNCSATTPLNIMEKEVREYIPEPGAFSIGVGFATYVRKYVECDECHTKAEFAE